MQIQEKGSYILMGYSTGGNLAYHVALELERRGKVVSDIIMIDSPRWEKHLSSIVSKYKNVADNNLDDNILKSFLQKEEVIGEMIAFDSYYTKYISGLSDYKNVSANIHLLNGEFIKQDYYKEDTRSN